MKLMNPDEVFELLATVPDVISPAVEARRRRFSALKCPACGGDVRPEVTAEDLTRLRADEVVPEGRARCGSCNCLFDPTTGLVAERGDIRRVLEPATHLLPKA